MPVPILYLLLESFCRMICYAEYQSTIFHSENPICRRPENRSICYEEEKYVQDFKGRKTGG